MPAILLQNGKQAFTDANSRPLAGGKVYFYSVGTNTPKDTWQDTAQTVLNTNPVVLDARGEASIYGTGSYRQVLRDASNVLIWDAVIPDLAGALQAAVDDLYAHSAILLNSVTELRALSKLVYANAQTTGYYAKADGGGGTYYLDTLDTTSADNGVSVIVATDGGRWKLRLSGTAVSIRQGGAKGDGTTDDTASIKACLLAYPSAAVLIPAGTFKFTATLSITTGQKLYGIGIASILSYQAVAPAANTGVLSMDTITDAEAYGFKLKVDPATYTTARCLYITGSTDCSFHDIELNGGGGNAGYIINSIRCSIKRVEVDDFRGNGFMIVTGVFNDIDACRIPNGVGGLMGVQLVQGVANRVHDCYIAKSPDNYFGIHSVHCSYADIYNNLVENTRREAIAVGGASQGWRLHNNTMRWTENLGVGDFGMSVAGDSFDAITGDWQITNNTISQSALSGIGIAGFCQRGIISGNIIRDCCQLGGSGFQQGIKLYGYITNAVVQDVVVENNTISKISGGGMLYAVTETPELGSVSGNIIRDNKTVGLSGLSIYSVTGTGSCISLNSDDLAGKIHTNPVTSSAGTITSATGNMRFQMIGKAAHCTLVISIPTNGTGSGQLLFALPFTANSGALNGREQAVNGISCCALLLSGGNSLSVVNYNNSYPGVSGASITLSGILWLP